MPPSQSQIYVIQLLVPLFGLGLLGVLLSLIVIRQPPPPAKNKNELIKPKAHTIQGQY